MNLASPELDWKQSWLERLFQHLSGKSLGCTQRIFMVRSDKGVVAGCGQHVPGYFLLCLAIQGGNALILIVTVALYPARNFHFFFCHILQIHGKKCVLMCIFANNIFIRCNWLHRFFLAAYIQSLLQGFTYRSCWCKFCDCLCTFLVHVCHCMSLLCNHARIREFTPIISHIFVHGFAYTIPLMYRCILTFVLRS